MLVTAHVVEVLLLVAGPLLIARGLTRRWKLPFGVFGVGLLTFVFGQVLQMGLAWTIRKGFEGGMLPTPSAESAALVAAILAGVAAAVTDEPLRLWAFQRYLPERTGKRTGVLVGLGHGGAQAMLGGILVLFMAGLAIVFEGKSFEDMQQMGMEGRSAIRLGMKVFAWWEQSLLDVVVAIGREAALVIMHIGLAVAVACATRRGWRFFVVAIVAHAVAASGVAFVGSLMPELWVVGLTYGGAAALGAMAGFWAARGYSDPVESAGDESEGDAESEGDESEGDAEAAGAAESEDTAESDSESDSDS